MKLIAVLSLLVSVSAFASGGAVFCQQGRQLVNVESGDWDTCNSELYTGRVCFAGDRKAAIKILNSKNLREKFSGTDGEYIKGARAQGRDSISYVSVDEPNEYSETLVINRCRL